jgi:putative serine protease PepD
VAGVAGRVLPSVVALQVTSGTGQGTGSGFVIDSRGYVLTNNHVVSSAAQQGRIDIVFQDGSQTRGRIVGRDENYDLAVLKADVGDRPPLRLGDSEGVVVGDPVIAIGAPLGLQGTVTTGIISAKNRPVTAGDDETTAFINALQTDTAINPGNSGGPLVDAAGEVIGVNSAIARTPGSTSSTGGNIGLGFAISSNQARRTAEQLIRTGRSEYPIIGVNLDQAYQGQGVRVATEAVQGRAPVEPGGPAGRAGIEAGDVITAIDGRPVTAPDELIVAIRDKAVGDTVTLSVRGDGGRAAGRDVRVTLVAAPRTAD